MRYTIIRMMNKETKQFKLLFFGYPSNLINYTGGYLWMKKVADCIEKSGSYLVLKTEKNYSSTMLPRKIINDLYNAVKALFRQPDVAILDSWGESNIILWMLLRVFKPKTKILVVFHHHEPRILISKNLFQSLYNLMILKLTTKMLKDSDTILTVSQASKHELNTIYGIGVDKINKIQEKANIKTEMLTKSIRDRIAIVGTGIDNNLLFRINGIKDGNNDKKDIDFLCIGRIEKFYGLEEIWKNIRMLKPNSNLVMIGSISPETEKKLRRMGIDHRGFVPEEEKINLYSRAKVFIFPSSMEGFGIAVAEALYASMPVVAWNLPVFEELYKKNDSVKIKLIEYGKSDLFAKECIDTLDSYSNTKKAKDNKKISLPIPNWQTVAQNVVATIESIK
ncbi:MAG TPA: glycosyltransferase family 4 protein [Candidatus Nitrosocosmicus sp.]|nr:glycosyltransferase family 4 protein [Candidatus Nitrosocosmicus sp.]